MKILYVNLLLLLVSCFRDSGDYTIYLVGHCVCNNSMSSQEGMEYSIRFFEVYGDWQHSGNIDSIGYFKDTLIGHGQPGNIRESKFQFEIFLDDNVICDTLLDYSDLVFEELAPIRFRTNVELKMECSL